MTTREQVQAILGQPRIGGAVWRKKDIAEVIGRDRAAISRILNTEAPINPNVRKLIDRLYQRIVNNITIGDSYIII
jgi:hypothetical protein